MAGGDLLFLSHGYLGDVGSQTSFARNPGAKAKVPRSAQARSFVC